jgi:hypothetical protein
MNVRKLMPLGVLLLAALPVSAGSDKGEKKVVVEEKQVTCVSSGGAAPVCKMVHGEVVGETVDVQVTEDGKHVEKKVVIVRRSMLEGADTNGDGMISKPEFLAHAEKHFAEMDRDKSGQLSKDEAMPQMPADMHKHMDGHHGRHGH